MEAMERRVPNVEAMALLSLKMVRMNPGHCLELLRDADVDPPEISGTWPLPPLWSPWSSASVVSAAVATLLQSAPRMAVTPERTDRLNVGRREGVITE